MSKCGSCRWWGSKERKWVREGHGILFPLDPDTYEPMAIEFRMEYCDSPLLCFWERPPQRNMATLVDGSCYEAGLITGEEFGCVNWEAKDGQDS